MNDEFVLDEDELTDLSLPEGEDEDGDDDESEDEFGDLGTEEEL